MKKTFKEKVISFFRKITRKHPFLQYPSIACMAVILFFYNLILFFMNNTKRLASIAFVVLFFMNSCSFSFAVFTERTGFMRAQEEYSAIIGDSDIMLATNVLEYNTLENVNEELHLEYDIENEYEDTDTAYTIDDLLEDEILIGASVDENIPSEDDLISNNDNVESNHSEDIDTAEENEYIFDSNDWRIVLINKQHPIPDDYDFTLGTIHTSKGNMQCDERVIEDLLMMIQQAKYDGINLTISSPYRPTSRQEYLFDRKMSKYMGQGLSYMDAYRVSSQIVTVPGSSEHQVGLAFDITCDTYSALDAGFGETAAGKWLYEHSHEYGFTLRYPKDKEYITSIEYEPWHFRYVGKEAALIMYKNNLCLEEFWDKYL